MMFRRKYREAIYGGRRLGIIKAKRIKVMGASYYEVVLEDGVKTVLPPSVLFF